MHRVRGRFDCGLPTNICIARGTPSVVTLVVVSEVGGGDRHLGFSKIFISLIYRLDSVSTPVQVLE